MKTIMPGTSWPPLTITLNVLTLGTVSVRTTVLKDGHTFVIHILDPKDEAGVAEGDGDQAPVDESATKDENQEKADTEKPEKGWLLCLIFRRLWMNLYVFGILWNPW